MVQRSTSDPATVKCYISKLDRYRKRTALQADDLWIVLRTFFGLYAEAYEGTTTNIRSFPVRARERKARLFGRTKSTVSPIVTDWISALKNEPEKNANDHFKSFSPSNRGKNIISYTCIDKDENTFLTIRNFVQEKRSNREKVTSRDVLLMPIANNFCTIETDDSGLHDKRDFQAALRSVKRYLSHNGFRRGKKSGSIRLSTDHLAWKDSHLRKITNNRTKTTVERLIEMHAYESYVHHYFVDTYNLYHPDDLPDINSPHKGRRFFFVTAIRYDPNLGQGSIVPNAYWCFCPTEA